MSGLSAAAAASSHPTSSRATDPARLEHALVSSASSSSSSIPSLTQSLQCALDSSGSSTASRKPAAVPLRSNEHLAVLLPKHLWKADSLARQCDRFLCRRPFGLFERRHHCRKCGGVFCAKCTSRTTPLLDTSNLPFLHPPRNVSIFTYATRNSLVCDSRVCDDCHDQIHGLAKCPSTIASASASSSSSTTSTSSRSSRRSIPVRRKKPLSRSSDGSASSLSSAVSTPPPSGSLPLPAHPTPTSTSNSSNSLALRRFPPQTHYPHYVDVAMLDEPSYGELDAYPLRRASALCKALGGGRWEPKPKPDLLASQGTGSIFEALVEQDEEDEKSRRVHPVIVDGEFQTRRPCALEPEPSRSLHPMSTF